MAHDAHLRAVRCADIDTLLPASDRDIKETSLALDRFRWLRLLHVARGVVDRALGAVQRRHVAFLALWDDDVVVLKPFRPEDCRHADLILFRLALRGIKT